MKPAGTILGLLLLAALPAAAAAQLGAPDNPSVPGDEAAGAVPFTNDPHPLNHFNWPGFHARARADYGTVVRHVRVPPRPLWLPVYVPAPGSLSGRYEWTRVVEPGYTVTETTTGWFYPARLAVGTVTYGTYRWVRTQAQFVPKR